MKITVSGYKDRMRIKNILNKIFILKTTSYTFLYSIRIEIKKDVKTLKKMVRKVCV
jgi:hypothetical protein